MGALILYTCSSASLSCFYWVYRVKENNIYSFLQKDDSAFPVLLSLHWLYLVVLPLLLRRFYHRLLPLVHGLLPVHGRAAIPAYAAGEDVVPRGVRLPRHLLGEIREGDGQFVLL